MMSAPVMLACASAVLALGVPLLTAATALDTQLRVSEAADSAALAAADAANGWIVGEPCAVAAAVASRMKVTLVECSLTPDSGEAVVVGSAATVFGRVSDRAKAGPP